MGCGASSAAGEGPTRDELLNFLETKQVMAEADDEQRVIKFNRLLDPQSVKASDPARRAKLVARYTKCRERLERLLAKSGDTHSDSAPDGVQTLQQALVAMPQWRDKNAFVHPCVTQYPAQRVQKSGLCYIHAPEIVQHYLVSITTKTNAGADRHGEEDPRHVGGREADEAHL